MKRSPPIRVSATWLALGALAAQAHAAAAAPPTLAQAATARTGTGQTAAATLEQRVDAALADFRARCFEQARTECAGVLQLGSDAESQSSLRFNIAACDYELGEYAVAERHFLELAEQDAGVRGSALARAGLAALARADRPAALRHLARLSEVEPTGSADRARLEAALAAADQQARERDIDTTAATPADELHEEPERALEAWARLAAGWDSNATQSSLSDASASTLHPTPSGYSSLGLGVALPFRLGADTSLAPYYRGDSNLLLASSTQELSEQRHEAGVDFDWLPSETVRCSLGAAGSLGLVGLSQLSPYDVELPLAGTLQVSHAELLQSAATLELRPLIGLPGYEWTSAIDVDAALGERITTGAFSAALEAGVRWHAARADHLPVSPDSLPACGTACEQAEYFIPLGYVAPRLRLRGGWAPTGALRLDATSTLELRDYAGESYLDGLLVSPALRERSRKDRNDWRWQLGVRARYALTASDGMALLAGYTWRLRRSNVAYSASDEAHALDYTAAGYDQHALEAGLELRY